MNELAFSQVTIQDSFWDSRLITNARVAIFHQWQQLEQSRCIDNFLLTAGEKQGIREGWFFADSDAYKWLEAAARVYENWPNSELKNLMDEFIGLISRVQSEDGYIFTYNQVHFPGEHWCNLMIEHELYCHGHLIEACIAHFEATGEETALNVARKAADLLVNDFLIASTEKTSGHEEIEIALLSLYQVSRQEKYLELARQFLERRGKTHPFAPLILKQYDNVAKRRKFVQAQRQAYLISHPEQSSFRLPDENVSKRSPLGKVRRLASGLTGKYVQQHAPIRSQTIPVGHAVRFAYLETAVAKLYRFTKDATLLPALVDSWEHMVFRRMYITGGIGSVPELEGFGRDYELDPELSYSETCAALGSLFWNWEMALITQQARYSDLFEWQLYNAAAVGMGLVGNTYLYNNPLLSKGGITRRPWFLVPCCPSNLSRTWASLGKYIYSYEDENLWIHQYIGNHTTIDNEKGTVDINSTFPWRGKVTISISLVSSSLFTIHFRIPSWSNTTTIRINHKSFAMFSSTPNLPHSDFTNSPASGFDPSLACFFPVRRIWHPGDLLELDFDMPVVARRASSRMHGHKDKVTITRGPLVYCLENIDNPGIDIFKAKIDPSSIRTEFSPALLGGICLLRGMTKDGKGFLMIPYHLWANRGESQMVVWINT
jgi:DUF1680 family protein